MAQLALHRFEGVMHNFAQRIMGTVILLFFIGYQLVTRRDGYIDSHPVRISFLMGVVWLFDRDVTTINVITKFLEPRSMLQNQVFDLVGFLDAAIGYVDGQLHDSVMTH
ncbi:MAG: hypothetical protein ABJB22_07015 [Verrucomicrobiota bacterium]